MSLLCLVINFPQNHRRDILVGYILLTNKTMFKVLKIKAILIKSMLILGKAV